MFKTVDVLCEGCQDTHVEMVDVPYGTALPDIVTCTVCGHAAKRLMSCQIAKWQVQERIHGEIINGKLVSKETGAREAREQHLLQKRLKAAKKARDNDTARDVQKELTAKQAEVKKKLTGQ